MVQILHRATTAAEIMEEVTPQIPPILMMEVMVPILGDLVGQETVTTVMTMTAPKKRKVAIV